MPQATDERIAQVRKWKGLNIRETANAISDNELVDAVNFDLTDGGALTKRTGFKTVHGLNKTIDTFTRADSILTMGSSEVSSDVPAHIWTPSGPNLWGISGNKAYRLGGLGFEQTVVDTGGTDHEVYADLFPVASDYIGLIFRYVDTNNHGMLQLDPAGFVSLYTRVAGSYVDVATQFTTWVSGDRFGVRVQGTTWTVFKNGLQILSTIVTIVTAGTKAGLSAYNLAVGSRFDNFSATSYNSVSPFLGANTVRMLGYFNTGTYQQFIARAGVNLYWSTDAITWTLIAGGPWGNVEHGVQYTDKFYMVRRDATVVQWDGVAAIAISGSPMGSYCRVFKDRLFIVNSYGVGAVASRIYFSNPFDFSATGWPATNYVGVGEGDGQVLTAVFNVQDYLIIFKTGAMWILYVQGSDTLAWILRPFNSEVGCISKNTLALHEGTLYFLSAKGVYQTDGNTSRVVSAPVSPIFDNIVVSSATINSSSAFAWQDKYVLVLETFPVAPTWASWSTRTWASLASTPWSGSGATYDYLVYHIRQKGWTKWRPATGFAPHTFVSVFLTSVLKGVYFGDRALNGKVYKYGEARYQDDISDYEVAAETKEMDFDAPTERKRGKWLGVELRGSGDFTVNHVVNGETTVSITKTATLDQELQKLAGPGYFRSWRTRFSATHPNPISLYGYALHASKHRHLEKSL